MHQWNHQLTYYIWIELSPQEHEAIFVQIIEIKVSQSESMLILELVRGLQMIRCLSLRAVRYRVNKMYFGDAEVSYLYNTWGIKLVIQRKAWELVGLSGNKPETLAEAQTLGEWLRALGIPKLWGSNVFVAHVRQADPWATNLYHLWKQSS